MKTTDEQFLKLFSLNIPEIQMLIQLFFLIFFVGKFGKDKTGVKIEFFSFLLATLLEMVKEREREKKNILQTFFSDMKDKLLLLPIIYSCGNFFKFP